MDFSEPPEYRNVRDAIRAITDKYGCAYFAERAAAHEPTTELWQDLAKHGFIGINLPEEYGGGGVGMSELAIVCEETAAHGCPLLLLLVSSAIFGELLTRYGTAEQRREWLPRMASGDTKVAFAITEPDAAPTPVRSPRRRRATVTTTPQGHQVLHLRCGRSSGADRRCEVGTR
jgi:alkylation response protein AidB-like acyl-CoA dehydrogenase